MNNSVLSTSYFSLSCCVCVFALLHSSIACHKLYGINLKEKEEEKRRQKAAHAEIYFHISFYHNQTVAGWG